MKDFFVGLTKKSVLFLFILPIDKNREVWYNFGRSSATADFINIHIG